MRKLGMILALILFFTGSVFAERVTQGEAINHFNEGVKFQNKGNFAAAASAYQKTIYLEPGPELKKLALNNLGAMFAKQEDFTSAEAAFRQALDIDAGYKNALANLGYLYYLKGDEETALKFLMKAEGLKEGKSDFVTESKQGQF